MAERLIDAVIFDLGGVLMHNGRPKDLTSRYPPEVAEQARLIMMGPYHEDTDHPWHRLERGEITMAECRRLNGEAFAAAGIHPPEARPEPPSGSAAGPTAPGSTDGGSARPPISFNPNEQMLQLVRDLRAAGLKTGMLTNNAKEFRSLWFALMPWEEMFDDIVDSSEVGLRKPNPAVYDLSLNRLGVAAGRAAFLDDVLSNVDAASAVGIHGIHVEEESAGAITRARTLAGLL